MPIGGGGLISGIAVAVKSLKRDTKIIGVQPENIPSMYESWRHGSIVEIEGRKTIADGLAAKKPGDKTFKIVKQHVDDILLVSEKEMSDTILDLLSHERILAEPAGVASLAAMVHRYRPKKGEKVVVVISGGNIDISLLSRLLAKRSR